MLNYQKVAFSLSAAKPAQFPRDGLPQIAFVGKSNVGKSSVINRVLRRKNFAYSSSTPGKTAQINFFKVEDRAYLVDLPGYGFARVSKQERERWGALMQSYFSKIDVPFVCVVIVDARHAPTENDRIMVNMLRDQGLPYIVVANKLDKLKNSQIEGNLAVISQDLELDEFDLLIPFSAEKGTGKDTLVQAMERMVGLS